MATKLTDQLWTSKGALDYRLTGTKAEINEMITKCILYPGAMVYCTDEDQYYVIKTSGSSQSAESFSGGSPISVTYSELKTLKTNSKLSIGSSYRITDYTAIINDSNAQSAGKQFDIIVVADSINSLCEEARVCLHSGDTYFASNNLSAWKVWYCFDNDTTRFAWALTSGKGVIYRMIDEYGNDCPYDFKNIKFKRYKTSSFSYLCYTASSTTPNSIKQFGTYTIKNQTSSSATITFTRNNSMTESPYINITSKVFSFVETFNEISVWSGSDDSGCPVKLFSKNNTFGHQYEYNMSSTAFNQTDVFEDSLMNLKGTSYLNLNDIKIVRTRDKWGMITKYVTPNSSSASSTYLFTFDCGGVDCTVSTNKVHNNIIKPWINDPMMYYADGYKQKLNNIVLFNNSGFNQCSSNEFDSNCYNITIGSNCSGLHFGDCCKHISVEDECKSIILDSHSKNSYISKYAKNIKFGQWCKYNIVGLYSHNLNIQTGASYNGIRSKKKNISLTLGKKDSWT